MIPESHDQYHAIWRDTNLLYVYRYLDQRIFVVEPPGNRVPSIFEHRFYTTHQDYPLGDLGIILHEKHLQLTINQERDLVDNPLPWFMEMML